MNSKMLKKSLVGLVLTLVAIPVIYFGGWPLRIVIALVILLSAYEIACLQKQALDLKTMIAIAVSLGAVEIFSRSVLLPTLTALLIVLIVYSLIDETYSIDHASVVYLLTFVLALGITGINGVYDANLRGVTAVYIGIACYMCDTAAYFIGSAIGKHKMIPRVSPNKTWEGAIGGYILGSVVSFVFGYYFCHEMQMNLLITASILLPIVGSIGDLAFSLVKRHYGIKDFGSLLPGHGGVLDRIDSLIFCLMLFSILMNIWGL